MPTIFCMTPSHAVRLNRSANALFELGLEMADRYRIQTHVVNQATVVDAGVHTNGSLQAGIWLAKLCMSDLAAVRIDACDPASMVSSWAVCAQTDDPVAACLASQYAGWPVQEKSYVAMGSGPMRLARGREPMLEQLSLIGTAESLRQPLVGILESDVLPSDDVIESIADQCDVSTKHLRIVVAPSDSLAGTIQVSSRCIETAMHKMHELGFDVNKIVSAAGLAPMPPVARRGDTIAGIGRTNDAILYGGSVTLWADAAGDDIAGIIEKIPSSSSNDYGQPFATIFEKYDHDFYQVDPLLFSPAKVTIVSLISGESFSAGQINHRCLAQSFA